MAVAGEEWQTEELSSRARAWAATMDGHYEEAGAFGEVRVAHAGTTRLAEGLLPLRREEREERENDTLIAGATRASGSGVRTVEEEPDPLRTCFERDRDRILHSAAFRRLAGKTQVFVFPADHQRTRLTHALEVAQVATAIASACRLNLPLTEAIALGHDCGHGPGGHASEDALAPFVEGGFDHARWGADVTLAALNLCAETLDGVRNHSWSRPAPATPEGEVVALADRIAYTAHDLEDAVHAGIVDVADLPSQVTEACGASRGAQLSYFVADVIDTTCRHGIVAMSPPAAAALSALRRFDYERIYLRPSSLEQSHRVIEMLRALVVHYVAHPGEMPPEYRPAASDGAVAYVAGMTDRYACSQAVARLDWSSDRLPRATG